MLKTITSVFTVILCVFLISCSSSDKVSSTGYLGKGDYEFVMHDSTGKKVSEGILTVKTYSESKVTGNYRFTNVIEQFHGYSSMSNGEFTGNINQAEKMVLINTNPNFADDNVFFNLKIGSSTLEGDWYYSAARKISKASLIKLNKK